MSETGIVRTYYDNDNTILQEEYFILNGIKEGEYKEYHMSGELMVSCNYVNGIKEGEYKMYCRDGRLKYICFFVNGEIIKQKEFD